MVLAYDDILKCHSMSEVPNLISISKKEGEGWRKREAAKEQMWWESLPANEGKAVIVAEVAVVVVVEGLVS